MTIIFNLFITTSTHKSIIIHIGIPLPERRIDIHLAIHSVKCTAGNRGNRRRDHLLQQVSEFIKIRISPSIVRKLSGNGYYNLLG
ncbi:hypothetical protein ZOSMA_146G00800 [Zostera marina]|uniref:Uncharacterized protein n=1 Tax=Zostera marina TaxID=29655 RepID=A0A0K9PXG6_ZOSMR|nr:hypothetical protein ZOSMA_146G00800 [Zostera marina]